MKKINLLLVAAGIAAIVQACSGSRASSLNNSASATAILMTDTAFAAKAAVSGMAEVALGKMASAKGSDPKVKSFGKMMIRDHGKANAELMTIAKSKNIMLPGGLDAEHQAKSDSLSMLSGKNFDQAYVQIMIEGHQKTLAQMQAEASGGQDPQLKAFAAKTAPVVQMHLTEITKIQDNIK